MLVVAHVTCRTLRVEVADKPLSEVDAGLLAVLIFEGDDLPEPLAGAPGSEDVKGGYKKTSMVHPAAPHRALVVGLGKRDDFEPERARVAGALAARAASSVEAKSLALSGPDADEPKAVAAALVEGAILGSYRFDRFKSSGDDDDDGERRRLEELTLLGDEGLADTAETARISAEAANFARELQDLPSNVVTPSIWPGAQGRSRTSTRASAWRSWGERRSRRRAWVAWRPSRRGPSRSHS